MKRSIVKDSKELKDALVRRWTEVFGKKFQTKVAEDAAKYGRKDILRGDINRYLHDPYSYNALSEDQLLWLAARWMIYVNLVLGERKGYTYRIPKKYDEKQAIEKLKQIYGINAQTKGSE